MARHDDPSHEPGGLLEGLGTGFAERAGDIFNMLIAKVGGALDAATGWVRGLGKASVFSAGFSPGPDKSGLGASSFQPAPPNLGRNASPELGRGRGLSIEPGRAQEMLSNFELPKSFTVQNTRIDSPYYVDIGAELGQFSPAMAMGGQSLYQSRGRAQTQGMGLGLA